ncbi:MAG: translocation and assembly module TamA [Gammaproteobacteria bacterium]|jgi:translocation and assembly module TamA
MFYCNLACSAVEVIIEGVDKKLKDSLNSALSIERQKDNEKLTSASIQALYKRSSKEISSTLQSYGYYHSRIEQSLLLEEDKWVAKFSIEPGSPILVRKVAIVISSDDEDDEVLMKAVANYPLKAGDQLNHGDYETGKRHIQNLANQRGYFDAEWLIHRLAIDTELKTADINLTFDSGTRYRYDNIVIPETVILPILVEKMVSIKSGDYFDIDQLVLTQQQLENANYFTQVEVTPSQPNETSKLVSINIQLTEKKKNAYRAGLGFGTDTGPRLAAAWDSHFLNMFGHRLETDLRLSLVKSSLSTSYLIPYFRNRENELGITSAISREDTDTSLSNKFQSSLQHLSNRWGWNETLSLTYQFEDFEVADTQGTSHLLIPGVSYWKSVSDNPIYARQGFRLSADLRGSGKGFISDVSFLQLTLRGKRIFPFGEDGRFISRAELGATLTSSFTDLPSSLRFFAGGDNSIRGFDIEALGPRNSTNEIIGGKYLAVGSIEYEHRVYKKWSLAVFSDFGNAFDRFSDSFEYSVGTGIRWQSPVGLIRIDLASGISESDYPLRLHIIVGPDL